MRAEDDDLPHVRYTPKADIHRLIRMSALGQKQTCAVQTSMSALPPKADMCGATRDVCFGPKADIAILLNQLIGNGEHARRNSQPEPFSGLGIDHQTKLRWLLDR